MYSCTALLYNLFQLLSIILKKDRFNGIILDIEQNDYFLYTIYNRALSLYFIRHSKRIEGYKPKSLGMSKEYFS